MVEVEGQSFTTDGATVDVTTGLSEIAAKGHFSDVAKSRRNTTLDTTQPNLETSKVVQPTTTNSDLESESVRNIEVLEGNTRKVSTQTTQSSIANTGNKMESVGVVCFRCGRAGHRQRDCPDNELPFNNRKYNYTYNQFTQGHNAHAHLGSHTQFNQRLPPPQCPPPLPVPNKPHPSVMSVALAQAPVQTAKPEAVTESPNAIISSAQSQKQSAGVEVGIGAGTTSASAPASANTSSKVTSNGTGVVGAGASAVETETLATTSLSVPPPPPPPPPPPYTATQLAHIKLNQTQSNVNANKVNNVKKDSANNASPGVNNSANMSHTTGTGHLQMPVKHSTGVHQGQNVNVGNQHMANSSVSRSQQQIHPNVAFPGQQPFVYGYYSYNMNQNPPVIRQNQSQQQFRYPVYMSQGVVNSQSQNSNIPLSTFASGFVPGNVNVNAFGAFAQTQGQYMEARNEEEQLRCYNCNEVGHLSRDCSRPRACFLCGETNHIAKQCRFVKEANVEELKSVLKYGSNLRSQSSEDLAHSQLVSVENASEVTPTVTQDFEIGFGVGQQNVCLNCNEVGHRLKTCPNQKKCFLCSESGHVARECPMAEMIKQKGALKLSASRPNINMNSNLAQQNENTSHQHQGQSLQDVPSMPVPHASPQMNMRTNEPVQQQSIQLNSQTSSPFIAALQALQLQGHYGHPNTVEVSQQLQQAAAASQYQAMLLQNNFQRPVMVPFTPYMNNTQYGNINVPGAFTAQYPQLMQMNISLNQPQNIFANPSGGNISISNTGNFINNTVIHPANTSNSYYRQALGGVDDEREQQNKGNTTQANVDRHLKNNSNNPLGPSQTSGNDGHRLRTNNSSSNELLPRQSVSTLERPTTTMGAFIRENIDQDNIVDLNFDKSTNENSETESSFSLGFPNFLNPNAADYRPGVGDKKKVARSDLATDIFTSKASSSTATTNNRDDKDNIDFNVMSQLVHALELQ